MLGAVATVFETCVTADCTGVPDPDGAVDGGLDGALVELDGAGAELSLVFEDPDPGAGPEVGVAVGVGAADPRPGDGELGAGVALEPGFDADAGVRPDAEGDGLTVLAPEAVRAGVPPGRPPEPAAWTAPAALEPCSAPVATRIAPDARGCA